jgi:hypothetical protein
VPESDQGLAGCRAAVTYEASPRRLAVQSGHVWLDVAPDRRVKQKLMPVAVAWMPHGKPTPRC